MEHLRHTSRVSCRRRLALHYQLRVGGVNLQRVSNISRGRRRDSCRLLLGFHRWRAFCRWCSFSDEGAQCLGAQRYSPRVIATREISFVCIEYIFGEELWSGGPESLGHCELRSLDGLVLSHAPRPTTSCHASTLRAAGPIGYEYIGGKSKSK